MKKSYKAVIVDDERLARNDLRNMLANYDNIEIVSETEDVNGTIDTIDQFKPDIIFLDIQMPGESGFDLFERINVSSKVIFVTAYDEYAIRAFEALCCEGMARVDLFVKDNDDIVVNEINTIPGFTRISMYPKLWAASGISYSELIDRLIELAIERFESEQKLGTDAFES